MSQPILHDKSRAVVAVSGPDAEKLLSGIITNRLPAKGEARYAALLTPQGKMMFDFFIALVDDRYLIDIDGTIVDDFITRLTIYKLRAKVGIEKTDYAVLIGHAPGVTSFPDPRHPALGQRTIAETMQRNDNLDAHHAKRIALGIPLGGVDFAYGDAFTHEADMDLLNGVDFKKGCYVGQEVVSRVHHKGGARKRIVRLKVEGEVQAPQDVMAGEKSIGTLTSIAGNDGLAMIRLDKAHKALAAGEPITVGGFAATLVKPEWMSIPFPGEAGFEASE